MVFVMEDRDCLPIQWKIIMAKKNRRARMRTKSEDEGKEVIAKCEMCRETTKNPAYVDYETCEHMRVAVVCNGCHEKLLLVTDEYEREIALKNVLNGV